MKALYVDASAVLRALFREPGVRVELRQKVPIVSSEFVQVQAFRALDHARLAGALDDRETARKSSELHLLLAGLHLFPVSDEVLEQARASFPIHVRAVDALHVATAQVLSSEVGPLEFWTHDSQSASAAMIRGLEVRGLPS